MKKSTKRFAIALAAILTMSLTACGGSGSGSSTSAGESPAAAGDTAPSTDTPAPSADAVEITFAGVTSDSAKLAALRFKEIAETESNGTLIINNFPDNQLGDDRVAIETTQFGDIDIGVSSTSPLATMYADFYLFDAPFLFLSSEDAYAGLDGPVGQQILQDMESIGLKGLCFWENGFRNFTNNKLEVRLPADISGMKVRTMENEVHLAAWKGFGANPTPMAFTEVFTALQQGTIDAQENPLGIIDGNKFQEVQKYVSLTQHVYTPYIVCMNLDKYNSLTDEQRAAIDKAAKDSTEYQRQESQRLEGEILAGFEGQGVTVVELTAEEKAAWQQSVTDNKVFDIVKDKMDHPEYLDQILGQ